MSRSFTCIALAVWTALALSGSTTAQSLPPGYTIMPHRDTTPPAIPTNADREKGFQLFSRHWMEAVFETTVPARNAPLASLTAFASPGEYEPVAFGLHALRDLQISLSATPLVSEAGYELAEPELRVARSLLIGVGQGSALSMPLILEKRPSYEVTSGTSRFCWVTAHIPIDAAPGTYHSEITIFADNKPAAKIPLSVQVLPIRLLSASELSSSTSAGQCAFDAWGGFQAFQASKFPAESPNLPTSALALAGPMPGKSSNKRMAETTSRGFSARRKRAIRSLTWAVSMNFKPPYLWKGILRRVSSASSTMLWCDARNKTA